MDAGTREEPAFYFLKFNQFEIADKKFEMSAEIASHLRMSKSEIFEYMN